MGAQRISTEDIIRRVGRLAADRLNWDALWQDVADYVIPRKNSVVTRRTRGQSRTDEIFDTTAIRANEKLAAGLFSFLAPPNKRWFALRAKQAALQRVEEVERWMADATRVTYEAIAASNFNLELHEHLLDLGCFGTGCLYVEAGRETALSFRNHHISTYYIEEDDRGRIDSVYRKFDYTARQAVTRWGEGAVGKRLREANAKEQSRNNKFELIHAVFPREERDDTKLDSINMPWASIYIAVDDKHVISEGGYPELPYMADRFVKASDEIYGRSPAMSVLPSIKLVNRQKRTILVAAEKIVSPPLLMPSDGSIHPPRTTPGAIIYYGRNGRNDKPEALQTSANIPLALNLVELEHQAINEAFYVDLFTLLAERDQAMTATEVLERVEEKLTILAPTLGRLQSELFDPLIARVIGILHRAEMFPELPPEFAAVPRYEIVYTNKIALAIKALETRSMGRLLEFLAPFVQINPSVMDAVDTDKVTRGAADSFGVPTEWIRPEQEVRRLRQQRAQAQQQAEVLEMARAAAETVPDLQGRTDETSPLATVAETLRL